jgi:hypothetical protein
MLALLRELLPAMGRAQTKVRNKLNAPGLEKTRVFLKKTSPVGFFGFFWFFWVFLGFFARTRGF